MMRQLQQDAPWEEPFDQAELLTNLRRLFADPVYGLVFLALDGEQAVGYLVICFDYGLEYRGKGAWVDELFVKAGDARKGNRNATP